MSSLWTPGGEVPVDRNRPSSPPPEPGPEPETTTLDDPEVQARYAEAQRQVLEAPAADVVGQHAAALYELAALHLAQPEPRLADARLLIDAVAALVEGGMQDRLGEIGRALAAAVPQLKMAYVQVADRAGNAPHASGDPEGVG